MLKKDAKTYKGPRRARGFRAIGPDIARLTKPLFGARGFASADVITQWPRIVGETIAGASIPEKVQFPRAKRTGGTLYLRVRPGGAATEIQHASPLLIERVNTYFGFGAIKALKIIQAPIPEAPPPATQPDEEKAEKTEDGDSLEEALDSLGRHVERREKRSPPPVDKGKR